VVTPRAGARRRTRARRAARATPVSLQGHPYSISLTTLGLIKLGGIQINIYNFPSLLKEFKFFFQTYQYYDLTETSSSLNIIAGAVTRGLFVHAAGTMRGSVSS
jgi:hypothetical protein